MAIRFDVGGFDAPLAIYLQCLAGAVGVGGHRLIVPLLTNVMPWLLKCIELIGCMPLQYRLMPSGISKVLITSVGVKVVAIVVDKTTEAVFPAAAGAFRCEGAQGYSCFSCYC